MKKYRGFYPSTNCINEVAYYLYIPEGEPKCIVQLAHGMCEHALMYSDFFRFLAERGCVVCGADAVGHGLSVRCREELGFFGEKNGWICLVRDMKRLSDIVKKKYPKLPIFLIGHSMGSFILREYLTWYGEDISGAILIGTSDGFEGQRALVDIARLMCLYDKGKYHNKLVMKAGCAFFCGKMHLISDGWDWLSRSRKAQEYMDKHSFGYTAKGYYDIITLLDVISTPDWTDSVPKNLPILLMSGLSDPVGNCGRGVAKLYKRLSKAGCTKVKVRLYKGARHMLLHEINRKQVYSDIYNWLDEILKRGQNEKTVS